MPRPSKSRKPNETNQDEMDTEQEDLPVSQTDSIEDQLRTLIWDQLMERRPSSREAAWQQLIEMCLKHQPAIWLEWLANSMETILDQAKRALKRQSTSKEVRLCLRLLQILSCQNEHLDLYAQCQSELSVLCLSGGGKELKMAALNCLCVLGFTELEWHSPLYRQLLIFVEKVMLNRETAIEVRKSAMNGYALLITADVNGYFWSDSDTVLPVLALIDQCLDHENLDVKIAGGEFMALIAEAESLHKKEYEHQWKLLSDKVDALTKLGMAESVKKTHKRERSVQKTAFRDIQNSISQFPATSACHYANTITIKLKKGDELIVDSWWLHRRYECMLAIFGDHLNSQLAGGNILVRGLLEMNVDMMFSGEGSDAQGSKSTPNLTRQQKRRWMMELREDERDRKQSIQYERRVKNMSYQPEDAE